MSVTMEELASNFEEFEEFNIVHKQDYYIVNFKLSNNVIKVHVSKELEYVFVESDEIDFSELNTKLIFDKNFSSINSFLKDTKSDVQVNKKEYNDIFGIFRDREVYNKGNCNFNLMYEFLNKSNLKSEMSISKIPKNLLYNKNQIIDIIIKEMKKVNSNKDHPHCIIPTDKPYLFEMYINLKDSMQVILELSIDPELYPFMPPKVKYISPSAKRSLVYNLSNISILEVENWNPTITLDWLITSIASNLSNLRKEFIEDNDESELLEIDKDIIEFSSIIGERIYGDIKLEFDYVKFSLTANDTSGKENKYWKSGVGYGYSGRNEWDIKKYVKDIEVKNNNISKMFSNFLNQITKNEDSIKTLTRSPVMKYIRNSICNCTLLDINKNKIIYESLLPLVKEIYTKLDQELNEWKLEIHNGLEALRQDITPMLANLTDETMLPYYVYIISIADHVKESADQLVKQMEESPMSSISSDKPIDLYNKMIKEEQDKMFNGYTINSSHRFSSKKSASLNPKALMRITSEFSSLRKNLPINWDTSIVVRASSDNLNIFSFVITGPKDTPYHNGIYEFHAYFPDNYPNCEPKVLLDTTGNSSVRFNPNLYNCGKVCLSLLGTWSGQDGESWNKDTSTFLQVLISIQSLILVEKPYFNEPGWEREMHTERGKQMNFNYNDNIRYRNLQWAIVDKIKNPAPGFESMIIEHFKFKRQEIIETVECWISESKKYSNEMKKLLEEFKTLV